MKNLLFRPMVQRGIAFCLLPAIIVVYSMTILAVPGKSVGELVLKRNAALVGGPAVMVNGQPASNGRTLFAASVITTPEEYGAVIDLGKNGRIELLPASSFILNADGTPGGILATGNMTVISADPGLGLKSATGESITPIAGETITAAGTPASRAQTGSGSSNWWIWALIIGGVVAGIVIATSSGGDDSMPISPVR